MKILLLLVSLVLVSPSSASAWTTNKINDLHKMISSNKNIDVIKEIGHRDRQTKRELLCLSLNIYHEARGSTPKDQWSVAFVTMNRVNNKAWGETICSVVWEQKIVDRKPVGQFSWTTKKKGLLPLEEEAWIQAQEIALTVYDRYSDLSDPTCGSTHFYAPKKVKKPVWAKDAVCDRFIGQHMYVKLASYSE